MAYLNSKRLLGVVCILALVVVALIFALPRTEAQVAAGDEAAVIKPSVELTGEAAVKRTWAEMEADAAKAAPGPTTVRSKPFRPTVSDQEYQQLKAQAAAGYTPGQEKAVDAAPGPAAPPVLKVVNFDGLDRNSAIGTEGVANYIFNPPDTTGAAGAVFAANRQYYMEVNNSHLRVWDVNTVTGVAVNVKSVPLNTFFGYLTTNGWPNAQLCFDPQAMYDPVWNRWIVTAASFQESTTVMRYWMAISTTSNPLGSYWVYNVNTAFTVNGFWDYPHIGMDQDAVIFTANYFAPAFVDGRMFAIAKAILYNGRGFSVPVFTGLQGSIAAPMVLDNNRSTFMVSAAPADNVVKKYTMLHSSRSIPTLAVANIPVAAYGMPPNAGQFGTTDLLDTLDSRFVNYSTQFSNRLFQVHTIGAGPFPVPVWYEFNTSTNAVIQTGQFFKSQASHDFNAHIAASTARNVFVTWTATVPGSVNAEVRFSGRRVTDPINVIPAGSLLAGSATFINIGAGATERWGDYSAVCLDPSNPARAWVVNEMIKANATWGSRIGRIGF